ncbi:MAG TPA: grasp-with-spasm system ATP-grasp peptide maturase [Chryseosolibacter sp.]
MIAVISNESGEPSTSDVVNWITYLGHDPLLLYGEYFGRDLTMDITFSDGKEEANFELFGKSFSVDDISVVWYRRDRTYITESINKMSNDSNREKIKRTIFRETNTLRSHVYRLLEKKKWLSHPKTSLVNKLDILKLAVTAGLKIPDTLVTTSKTSLLTFFNKHDKKIIIKPISESIYLKEDKTFYSNMTRLLKVEVVSSMPETFFPCLVQKCIDSSFEIRVFYLDGKCYSIAVFFEQGTNGEVDSRREYRHLPKCCYQLPESVEKKIDKLMKNLRMETGSLDLIRTPNGEFIFLEVNPVGQFSGMISYPGNYYLEKKIAQYLIKKSND